VFRPSALQRLESQNDVEVNNALSDNEPRLQKVHRAFWISLGLILLFGGIGFCAELAVKYLIGGPDKSTITVLQISGALLLLWGTLFVRGFEIQSYTCATLSERVNQWLYRALYCIGTSVIICSVVWERI